MITFNDFMKHPIAFKEGAISFSGYEEARLSVMIVNGSLRQLKGERGANKNKLRSFELLRNNQKDIEIITFDELYERARFIVYNNQIQLE